MPAARLFCKPECIRLSAQWLASTYKLLTNKPPRTFPALLVDALKAGTSAGQGAESPNFAGHPAMEGPCVSPFSQILGCSSCTHAWPGEAPEPDEQLLRAWVERHGGYIHKDLRLTRTSTSHRHQSRCSDRRPLPRRDAPKFCFVLPARLPFSLLFKTSLRHDPSRAWVAAETIDFDTVSTSPLMVLPHGLKLSGKDAWRGICRLIRHDTPVDQAHAKIQAGCWQCPGRQPQLLP